MTTPVQSTDFSSPSDDSPSSHLSPTSPSQSRSEEQQVANSYGAHPEAAQLPHKHHRKRHHTTKAGHAHGTHPASGDGARGADELAGWGKGGERFGGMAQAGLREGEAGQPVLSDAASGFSQQSGGSETSFYSGSTSSDDGGSDASDVEEVAQPARTAKSVDELRPRREEQVQARNIELSERDRFKQGGSKSYYGGSGQGYMRMLHALAQDDDSSSNHRRRSSGSRNPFSSRRRDLPEQQAKYPPQAVYTHNGPPIPNDPSPISPTPPSVEQDKEHDADHSTASTAEVSADEDATDSPSLSQFISPPERAAQSRSLARCPSERAVARTEDERAAASQADLSAARPPTARRRSKKPHGGKRDDLSKSSIFAIHQPIEDARRQQRAEVQASLPPIDTSVAETDEENAVASRPARPGNERTDTASTARTDRTVARRERLAEKLSEIFGLEEPEEVVAEYPCWLFRSILLEGFLYLTVGHLCFYAYLQQKEGATIRSGSLSVRGSKTRRYHKHWFVLKDSVLSWFPSSTDPYFPDGHIDLHYCVSVEPSEHHDHHFKVSTSDKKWHFSADSTASRDEWVKTLKKVVFRCQNEGESVKIAIPLETVVDVEKSSGLEFAETIRVRVYDADEGYSMDEYWLSYFKDLDGALDKINAVLADFRRAHPEGANAAAAAADSSSTHLRRALSPIEDTTRRAVVPLGETDQVKGVDGERGTVDAEKDDDHPARSKSLGERVSSVLSVGSKSSKKDVPGGPAPAKSAPPAAPASTEPTPARKSSGDSTTSAATGQLSLNTKLATIGGTAVPVEQPQQSGSSTATPVAGSVATLRPKDEVAAQGVSPLAAAAAMPLPPPVTVSAEGAPALGGVEATPRSSMDTTETSSTVSSAQSVASAPAAEPVEPEPTPAATPAPLQPAHTYPPAPSPDLPAPEEQPPRRSSTLSKLLSPATSSGRRILEVVTHPSLPGRKKKSQQPKEGEVVGGPISEEPEDVEQEEEEKDGEAQEVRRLFGLGEKEEPVEQFPAYLFRGLPIYGRVYITSTYFCFKSNVGPLTKTKMILPITDIIGVSKHRSYRLGFSGLMVVIKGHEEVFLELSSVDRRDACLAKLEQQRELVRAQRKEQAEREKADPDAPTSPADSAKQELQALLDLSSARDNCDSPLDKPHPRSEAVPGQPPIMFSSTTSDFVTFRPEEPLRFTCLTIGSRGDVQPYIALCKGLMAQGHKCKIASHGEYRKWVEGHGIEFSAVGGDPAELMQLMISHDFFTISFMKEAVGRFRGWLDDLLDSAWMGCQDTDVLIESPSAIAGYHIAEALRVPYYRAFTMPWSRTRAYPHAFAVPEVHMGGGYNYMTYTMFDQVFWRATSGQVNRWRRESLKLKPTSLEQMAQHKIPFLYNFSPVVIPPPLDWRENIHVTGYWWLDNPDDSKSKKWEPPEDLLKWLDEAKEKDKKVVFIGFGSIIIPDPLEMTRVVAEAVERAGVYAIVARGWSDRASSKGDSDDEKKKQEEMEKQQAELMDKPFIFNVKSIPHDWLFPRIHAAVHHGGAGTTGASLRAGLPTIIKPFFGDQHFYADRVSTLGIGSHIRNFNADNLSEALITAVTDEKQIERARLAGEEIRKEDGVATAIECIYRDLEYARSLIPPTTQRLTDEEAASAAEDDKKRFEDDADSDHDEKKQATKDDDSKGIASGTPAKSRSRSRTPERQQRNDPSSPQTESRTTSSDEGWDVMSRGSAADASASWEKDSASRASSVGRSREASGPASPAGVMHDQGEERKGGKGDEGDAEAEPQSGMTARLLSMLGKSSSKSAAH
ncbi:hypothetical protein JCM8097_008332 [Rhodosporidiobolus ruineniae]